MQISPLRVLLSVVVVIALVRFTLTRTRWERVDPSPVVRRRRAGQLARASLERFRAEPRTFLGIGVLAVLLGITMWLQFKLNPAQMDPAQQQVFAIMPWFMMFIMAGFQAGLLIYWITSNLLSIGQQAYLYSRHPQLKAQTDKEAVDHQRAKARGK